MNEGQMVIEATVAPVVETITPMEIVPVVETITPETVVVVTETITPVVVDIVAQTILAESPVKKGKKGKVKRKPGRPPVYNGTDRRIVAAALKKFGLTKGIEFLATERNLKVSMTLARAVALKEGLEFPRGRPKIAA